MRALGLSLLLLFALLFVPALRAGESDVPPAEVSLHQPPDALLGGVQHAVCYSGYRKGQFPDRGAGAVNPAPEQILEDLRILTRDGNFRLIRMYGAGEKTATTLRLIRKHDLDLKVMVGAWLAAEVSNPACPWHPEPYADEVLEANRRGNAVEVQRAIGLANEFPEIVAAVSVGNEALVSWTDHLVPLETLIGYVRQVKAAVTQPVTVAENYVWWAEEGEPLARELDFVSVHLYPVWEERDIDEGLSYSIENLRRVRESLPESRLVIAEAGWASTASEFGDRASQTKQKRYYEEMFAWTAERNVTLFFFEAFDESWKGNPDNPAGAEKHWGLFTEERRPKLVVQARYPDLEPAGPDE